MKTFIEFLIKEEDKLRSLRKEFFKKKHKHTTQDIFKARLQDMTDEEKEQHVRELVPFETIHKAVNSSHSPNAPIDLTRELPDSVKALSRALVYRFEEGIRQTKEGITNKHFPTYEQGKKKISATSYGLREIVGEHYRSLMVDNKTRHIFKEMIAKK